MKVLVLVVIVMALLIMPCMAQEVTTTNTASKVYVSETTLTAVKTTTAVPTAILTTVPTVEPTPEPTENIIEDIINVIIPQPAPTTGKVVQAEKIKDRSPKVSRSVSGKLQLTFDTIISEMKVTNADNQNETISKETTGSMIELPVDISKPGSISVKIESGGMVYIIRRGI